ncbi:hypothetical protein [Amycolatopsis anabasis]|uniref:hypothetical protein n=1 Tax=Amycolatopsis anabasis TaxID=1840409 RepID=UPI00131BFD8E|nr:hypothetical protein [Amycolatopsis anabasis]
MFDVVLALPRFVLNTALRTARSALRAVEGIPRIATALEELRDAIRHVERLATFAAEELPEVVYQLESVREQLAAIEKRLAEAGRDRPGISPGSPRNG